MPNVDERILELTVQETGAPYVFGARGAFCTPAARGKYVSDKHPTVKSKCQVLNGSKSTCDGCKYKGRRMYDCRGYTYWILKQLGIIIKGSGATSQWKDDNNWALKGPMSAAPKDCVFCGFKEKNSIMEHTGLWVPQKQKFSNASSDVMWSNMTSAWNYFAVPKGLYDIDIVNPDEGVVPMANQTGKFTVTAESGSTVRLRKSASKNSKILYEVPIGSEVEVIASDNNWAKIHFVLEGYMQSQFLKKK